MYVMLAFTFVAQGFSSYCFLAEEISINNLVVPKDAKFTSVFIVLEFVELDFS